MRIVSVSPLPADLDSRSYRIAASFARMGHESILVEGRGSLAFSHKLPFELVSAGPVRPETTRLADPTGADTAVDNGAPPRPAAPREPAPPIWPIRLVPLAIRRAPRRALGAALKMRRRIAYLWGEARWNVSFFRAMPAADLYYLHAFNPFPAVRLASWLRRVPYVYDSHDSYFEVYSGLRFSELPPGASAMMAMERICVRQADAFVSTSEGVCGLLEKRYGRAPVRMLNYHDVRLDQPVAEDLRTRLGLGEEDFLFVAIGHVKTGTANAIALHALRELPGNCHLAFVGQQQRGIGRLIEELGLNRRAHLVRPVATTQVKEFVKTADASVILHVAADPNYANLTPLRLFHSVAAGLPLLYARLPGIEALARRYVLGIGVDPENPVEVAAGMRALASPEVGDKLRANVENARDELSWERHEHLLANLLSALIADGGAPARPPETEGND